MFRFAKIVPGIVLQSRQFFAIGPFMLNFGRLKSDKTGFSVITFLQKIITYSPERFSNSSPLVLSFRVV